MAGDRGQTRVAAVGKLGGNPLTDHRAWYPPAGRLMLGCGNLGPKPKVSAPRQPNLRSPTMFSADNWG